MTSSLDYRERCFQEKGEICAVCGETDGVVAHHVDGDRSNDDLENLVPVCGRCHKLIHRAKAPADMKIAAYQEELPDSESRFSGATAGEYILDPCEDAILSFMEREWRVTPAFIAEETGYPRPDINDALRQLVKAGKVERVTRGLYDYTGNDE